MKLGTQIRMSDGQEATVVYNGLDGIGVVFGLHDPSPDDFVGSSGSTVAWEMPDDFQWEPEALLVNGEDGVPTGWSIDTCIGDDYEVLRIGLGTDE